MVGLEPACLFSAIFACAHKDSPSIRLLRNRLSSLQWDRYSAPVPDLKGIQKWTEHRLPIRLRRLSLGLYRFLRSLQEPRSLCVLIASPPCNVCISSSSLTPLSVPLNRLPRTTPIRGFCT